MIPADQFKNIHTSEMMGSQVYGWFGLKIDVAARKLPDFEKHQQLRYALMDAEKIITEAYHQAMAEENAEFMAELHERQQQLLACFPQPLYHEQIPNEYQTVSWDGKLKPWFRVTLANVGHFKVGERRHVIHLEWTDTRVTATAQELFPKEDVTKSARTIHAHSGDDLRRYIQTIIDAAPAL